MVLAQSIIVIVIVIVIVVIIVVATVTTMVGLHVASGRDLDRRGSSDSVLSQEL